MKSLGEEFSLSRARIQQIVSRVCEAEKVDERLLKQRDKLLALLQDTASALEEVGSSETADEVRKRMAAIVEVEHTE